MVGLVDHQFDRDPQQQQPAGQLEIGQGKQLNNYQREQDAQHHRSA